MVIDLLSREQGLTFENGKGQHEHDVDEDDPSSHHSKGNPHPKALVAEVEHVEDGCPKRFIRHVWIGLLPTCCTTQAPSNIH